MNEKYLDFRTDMADERVDTYKRVHNLSEIDGVKVTSDTKDGVITTTVEVLNENGATALKKEIGTYITMEIQDLKYLEEEQKSNVIIKIKEIVNMLIGNERDSIFVLGLGNVAVTPDALGPKVVQQIEVTRHLLQFAKELVESDTRSVCALAPGVLGTTGIETSEMIEAVIKKVPVNKIIAIDSLASQSIHRVGNTIQFSNTGITPGSGVRNKRTGINEKTLGIPVIAIGVPTVVDMATITNEAIDKMLEQAKEETKYSNEFNEQFIHLEKGERYQMIANFLDTENYIVTPKEIDSIIEKIASMIAEGMNQAF